MANQNDKNQPNQMPGQKPQNPNERNTSGGNDRNDISRKQGGNQGGGGMQNPGQNPRK